MAAVYIATRKIEQKFNYYYFHSLLCCAPHKNATLQEHTYGEKKMFEKLHSAIFSDEFRLSPLKIKIKQLKKCGILIEFMLHGIYECIFDAATIWIDGRSGQSSASESTCKYFPFNFFCSATENYRQVTAPQSIFIFSH